MTVRRGRASNRHTTQTFPRTAGSSLPAVFLRVLPAGFTREVHGQASTSGNKRDETQKRHSTRGNAKKLKSLIEILRRLCLQVGFDRLCCLGVPTGGIAASAALIVRTA